MSVGIIWVLFQVLLKIGITLERRGDDIYIRRMKMGTKLKQILTVQFLPSQMRLGQDLRLIY
jgi:hypothetical protein